MKSFNKGLLSAALVIGIAIFMSCNKGLDYIYDNTFGKNKTTRLSDVLHAADKYVFEESPITNKSKDDRSKLFSAEHRAFLKVAVSTTSIITNRELLLKKLTPAQLGMIEKLDAAFSLPTYKEKQDRITDLSNEAIATLNENEVLSSLSLAKHSLAYWEGAKGKQWNDRINQFYSTSNGIQVGMNGVGSNEHVQVNKIDWHNVAVADVAAFIIGFPGGVQVGALVGGITAGIASAGITAGLGAVLGGVVGGTASGLASAISASGIALAAEVAVDWFGW